MKQEYENELKIEQDITLDSLLRSVSNNKNKLNMLLDFSITLYCNYNSIPLRNQCFP